uniref:Uncharacterized protein n=1 Tax=Candidatus Kentrum sp. DK TaxID=2126562 RepID=A0A450T0F2_9GAMM|nr:MAG: hypothetical protein BECKDK2373B_GA0170837_10881 [Candidatus Kentron sp. DK]
MSKMPLRANCRFLRAALPAVVFPDAPLKNSETLFFRYVEIRFGRSAFVFFKPPWSAAVPGEDTLSFSTVSGISAGFGCGSAALVPRSSLFCGFSEAKSVQMQGAQGQT